MSYQDYLRAARDTYLAELVDFLRIPSISALAQHKEDCRRAAAWLSSRLQAAGLANVRIYDTPGNPLVYAEWLGQPGAPTVLVYGHYDVQPVDPLDLWVTPPFEPSLRDGRIWARGASDDKGQLLVYVQAAQALLQATGELPVNVKFLFEGEEEIGSVHLAPFVREHADMLAADAMVISDTEMVAAGMPTICCSIRGIITMELTVYGPNTDLHSGLYGGAVANPLHVLVELLAGLRDRDGRISVPGFYDDVEELSAADREQLAKLPFAEADLQERLGVPALAGEAGYSALERMTVRPTLEINGMWGGFQGEGSKTVIPATAHAKISCRLVPRQDPERIGRLVADYLRRACPGSVRVEVELGHGGRPWACSPQQPELQAAVRALEQVFARPVALARTGGSIPVVDTFASALNVPIVMVGYAPPDANAHAPNESFDLNVWEKALAASCHLWQELGTGGRGEQ